MSKGKGLSNKCPLCGSELNEKGECPSGHILLWTGSYEQARKGVSVKK